MAEPSGNIKADVSRRPFDFQSDGLEIMRIAIEEEQYHMGASIKFFNFYAVLLSTILAASTSGIATAFGKAESLLFLIGPFVILFVAHFAKQNVRRFYVRALEAISCRAKIEQAIGLTLTIKAHADDYWAGEPVIAPRHIASRKSATASDDFLSAAASGGSYRWMKRVFSFFQLGALLLSAACILALVWQGSVG